MQKVDGKKSNVDAGSAADVAAAFLAFVVSRVIRFWRVHWELHKKPNWKHVMLLLLLLLSMLLLPLLLLQLMILLLLLLLLLFSAWSFSFWLWLWQSSAWLAHGASRLSYKNACRLADSRVVCIRLSAEQHIPSSKATLLHPTRLRTAVAFQSVSVDILRIDSAIKKKKNKVFKPGNYHKFNWKFSASFIWLIDPKLSASCPSSAFTHWYSLIFEPFSWQLKKKLCLPFGTKLWRNLSELWTVFLASSASRIRNFEHIENIYYKPF